MNRGSIALARKCRKRGALSALAKRSGLDQGYLSRVARGERKPGIRARLLLEEHAAIAIRWWDQPIQAGEAAA